MTYKEAIAFLKTWNPIHPAKQEARDMAVEALARQQCAGTWRDRKDGHTCPVCHEVTYVDRSAWKDDPFDFCPRCGARLEVSEQEE